MKRLVLRLLALGAAKAIEHVDPYQRLLDLIESAFGRHSYYEDDNGIVVMRTIADCAHCDATGCATSGAAASASVACDACHGRGRFMAPYTFADWIGELLGSDAS